MALSPSDPYYRAEVTPQAVTDMAAPLCRAFGVPADAFGSKGNLVHESGYHRSRNWVLNSPDSAYGPRDYSVRQPLDLQGDGDWISAFDFTPGVWGSASNRARMVQITKRFRAAARANDPRLADLREIAGTEDGVHVVTFYAQGGADKDPFDASHLEHVHGSFWRGRAANNHQGIVDVMLGSGQGDEDDMGASWPPIEIKTSDPTSIPLVETEGGGADPRPQWLRIVNETGGRPGQKAAPAYALRIMGGDGKGGWAAVAPTELVKLGSNQLGSWQLKKGITLLSIARCALDKDGKPVYGETPTGGTAPYGGHLMVIIERGEVVH